MEKKVIGALIKMHFIKRRTISIVKINTKRIVLSRTISMVKEVHLNILLHM